MLAIVKMLRLHPSRKTIIAMFVTCTFRFAIVLFFFLYFTNIHRATSIGRIIFVLNNFGQEIIFFRYVSKCLLFVDLVVKRNLKKTRYTNNFIYLLNSKK